MSVWRAAGRKAQHQSLSGFEGLLGEDSLAPSLVSDCVELWSGRMVFSSRFNRPSKWVRMPDRSRMPARISHAHRAGMQARESVPVIRELRTWVFLRFWSS
jgi:hypothetical protein